MARQRERQAAGQARAGCRLHVGGLLRSSRIRRACKQAGALRLNGGSGPIHVLVHPGFAFAVALYAANALVRPAACQPDALAEPSCNLESDTRSMRGEACAERCRRPIVVP